MRIMREEKKKHEKEEKKKIEAFYRVQLFFQNKRRGYPVALSDSMSALFFFAAFDKQKKTVNGKRRIVWK